MDFYLSHEGDNSLFSEMERDEEIVWQRHVPAHNINLSLLVTKFRFY
jgi:hypothetical protein